MSSRGPPLAPETSAAGIALNPRTLDRVIPATRRPDGSIRKEIRIRPGYTPAEDIAKFRTSRQDQLQRNAVPKGTVLGWTPPPDAAPKPAPKATTPATSESGDALSAAAKKNAKRAEKRKEKRKTEQAEFIRKQFEGDDDDTAAKDSSPKSDAAAPKDPAEELADKLKEVQVS